MAVASVSGDVLHTTSSSSNSTRNHFYLNELFPLHYNSRRDCEYCPNILDRHMECRCCPMCRYRCNRHWQDITTYRQPRWFEELVGLNEDDLDGLQASPSRNR